jgi:parallel beta-helix repeat protein
MSQLPLPYVTPVEFPGDDDTAPLQQALTAAKNTNATVWLMGAYTISKSLWIPPGVRVMGQGPAVTSITAATGYSGGNPMLVANDGVTVEGITLAAAPGSTVSEGLLAMQNVSGVRVRHCVMTGGSNANTSQIYISGCTDVVVSDCEVSGGPRGISVIEACVDVRIVDCNVHDITEAAIYVSASENASVRTVISGCRISGLVGPSPNATNYPLYFGTVVNPPDNPDGTPTCYHLDSRVIGNHVEGNYGMSANKPTDWPDDPNAGGTADNIGIYQCRGAVVAHNHTYYGGDLGISLQNCDRCIVTANVCGVNDTDGIAVYYSTNCIVSGNLSFNNGRDWDGYYRNSQWPRLDFSGIVQNSKDVLVAGNRCWEDESDYPPANAGTPPANPGRQQFGVYVHNDNTTDAVVADNQLSGNVLGWVKVPTGQLIGSQYDGTGYRFDPPIRLVASVTQDNLYAPVDAGLVSAPSYDPSGDLQVASGQLGFFGTQPAARPVVTGTTTDPVVTSLVAALQGLGLITVAGA